MRHKSEKLSAAAVAFAASMLGAVGLVERVDAATLQWDADGATPGILDGAGTWSTAGNWWNGTSNTNFVATTTDVVFGGNGSTGTPGLVKITTGSTTVPKSLTFNVDGYTVEDTSSSIRLLLSQTGPITANANATIRTFRGAVMMTGAPNFVVAPTKTLVMDNTPEGANILIAGNVNTLGLSQTLTGGGTVEFKTATTAFTLGVVMHTTLNVTDGKVLVSTARASDNLALVIRSRSDFANPAGKVVVNALGSIDLGTNVIAIQQNTAPSSTVITGFPGELHLSGGSISLGGFGNPTAATPLASNGVVYLKGGTIRATTSNVNFLPAPFIPSGAGGSGPQALYVSASGGTIDTNGFDITSQNPLIFDPLSLGGGFSKIGSGTLTMTAASTYTGATNVTGGTLRLETNHTASSALNVSAGASVVLASDGTAARAIKTPAVTIAVGGKVDLQDNKLITASGIGTHNGTNYTGITGQIELGRNGGVWDAPGITTSMPDATGGSGYTALGVATGSEARGIGASDTDLWGGQTVTGSDTLVMYTYGGDANLSGNVDIDDYGQIDFNASTGGVLTGWYNGDFDYNGLQDIDDYGVIDFVVGIQGAPFFTGGGVSITAVPEPASIGVIALAALSAVARRKRRN